MEHLTQEWVISRKTLAPWTLSSLYRSLGDHPPVPSSNTPALYTNRNTNATRLQAVARGFIARQRKKKAEAAVRLQVWGLSVLEQPFCRILNILTPRCIFGDLSRLWRKLGGYVLSRLVFPRCSKTGRRVMRWLEDSGIFEEFSPFRPSSSVLDLVRFTSHRSWGVS